jgi:8-oxo-dGTP pyrophosphatase MutT (NUDIX family)
MEQNWPEPQRTAAQRAAHEAVTVQRAASVLLLRESVHGLEVFIQHRTRTMDFAPGVVVYPGGRVDEQDAAAIDTIPEPVAAGHAQLWRNTSLWALGEQQSHFASAVVAAAAIREVWEETGARLHPRQLVPWANWITPLGHPKRFDTFFYVAGLDAGQQPRHQTTEALDSHWITPRQLLKDTDSGRLRLMAPTRATLLAVMNGGTLPEVLDRREPVSPVPPAHLPTEGAALNAADQGRGR